MIKVVIIGLGTISDMHAKSYIANPEAELYGVCDVNKERAHTVATKYKIQKV